MLALESSLGGTDAPSISPLALSLGVGLADAFAVGDGVGDAGAVATVGEYISVTPVLSPMSSLQALRPTANNVLYLPVRTPAGNVTRTTMVSVWPPRNDIDGDSVTNDRLDQ